MKKTLFESGKKLPLVDRFYTIQGEGYHAGRPSYFVRLGGCDIGCEWCDTRFSWDSSVHELIDTDIILSEAEECPAKELVVTGGEPLMYNLDYLCAKARSLGVSTYLETSGNNPLSGSWDWICLSPKKKSPPLPDILPIANELKVVIMSRDDLRWAEENAGLVSESCKLYLQPEWKNFRQIIGQIVEYVKIHPMWHISLQAHKFMKIP